MQNCHVLFQYSQEKVTINCQKNELMNDIIARYNEKTGLSVDQFHFFYDDKKINPNITLSQLNKTDSEIIIHVNKKINGENEIKKSSSINDMMSNEITIKIKIEQIDINNIIYFLDNTKEGSDEYFENGIYVKHNHDNLKELNENNTILIIDGKTVSFKKFFIPIKCGIYTIKLLFKNK